MFLLTLWASTYAKAEKIDDTHYRFCVMDNESFFVDPIAKAADDYNLTSDPDTWEAKDDGIEVLGKWGDRWTVRLFFKDKYEDSKVNLIHHYYLFDNNADTYPSKTEFNIKIVAPTGVEFIDYPEQMNVGERGRLDVRYIGNFPKFVGGGYFEAEFASLSPDVIHCGTEGYISAMKVGKATLTVKAYAKNRSYPGSVYIGSHSIDIEVKDDDPPTSISMRNNMYVAVGERTSIILVSDAQAFFTWESSDPEIAEVIGDYPGCYQLPSGKFGYIWDFTGKKRGTCTLTCTTHNGISATCVVRVLNKDEFEYSNVCIDGIYYNFDPEEKTAEVVGVPEGSEPYKGTLTIPSEISWLGSTFKVIAIGERAFSQCEVESVRLPDSLKQIKSQAFLHSGLTYVDIPNSVESIGESAFEKCELIESVYLGKNVSSIGLEAFAGCPSLKEFYVSDENTRLKADNGVLYDANFTTLKLVPGAMNSVNIRPTVKCIGAGAFSGNQFIETITFPDKTTTIEKYACADCPMLKDAVIPDDVVLVGDSAFSGCRSISRIELGEKVSLIGEYAFGGSSDVSDIYVYSILPPQISATTFANYEAKLYVPVGRKGSYANADYWENFSDIKEIDASGIENLQIEESDDRCDIYNAQGILIKSDVLKTDIKSLPAGIYIIKGEKIFLK